jgi:hypothetical protein
MIQSSYMSVGNIHYVDVVANAGAIGRFIIIPEHGNRCSCVCCVKNQWDEVGLRIVRFADFAFGVCPGSVEIPQ